MAEYALTDEQILAILASLATPYEGTAPTDLLTEPRAIARAQAVNLVRWLMGMSLYLTDDMGRKVRVFNETLWQELCREKGVENG